MLGGELLETRHGGSVREVDVGPAVSVGVERGDPAWHRLDEMLAGRRAMFENEVQSRILGHVNEADFGCRRVGLPGPKAGNQGGGDLNEPPPQVISSHRARLP